MSSMQGTYEFMSRKLRIALKAQHLHPYLHPPVDDLESFYTAQWAVAFNDGASGRKQDGDGIRRFREMISGGERSAASDFFRLSRHGRALTRVAQTYNSFFVHSAAILHPWLYKLDTPVIDWVSIIIRAEDLDDAKRKNYLDYNFLGYGYRGVGEYFELIHEHRALLEVAV